MKVHEYQAKEVFRKYDITTLRGKVATTPEEAKAIADEFGGLVAIKSQVHVGGRGKAGGIKLAKTPDEAFAVAKQILGMDIKGLIVEKVLVEEGAAIDREFYVGIVQDRAKQCPVFIVSAEGGVEIEVIAAQNPDAIVKVWIDPYLGLHGYQAYELAKALSSDINEARAIATVIRKLYKVFVDYDATLVEINPFIATKDGEFIALDGKLNIDDNALPRHPGLADNRDDVPETELIAKDAGLSFVPLDGDVACIVNGAGLAMTTMDLIKLYGGDPANFLDVGGSSSPDKIVLAMDIILQNPNVKSILVNIFGGITRCDDVARGLLQALEKRPLDVPLIVRLTGTNEDEARKILSDAGITAGSDMDDAVKAAVAAAE